MDKLEELAEMLQQLNELNTTEKTMRDLTGQLMALEEDIVEGNFDRADPQNYKELIDEAFNANGTTQPERLKQLFLYSRGKLEQIRRNVKTGVPLTDGSSTNRILELLNSTREIN